MRRTVLATLLTFACSGLVRGADAASVATLTGADALYPELEKLYLDLHQNPELSFQEVKTSAKLADRLRALGYEVTTGLGKTGVAATMKNGNGPTVLVRADMDALPVEEKTGLSYASKAKGTNENGETVPVMHACGHDVHMTSLIGAAMLLSKGKDRWRGTLLIVAQPAEEGGGGAGAMIRDGLFQRAAKPDFAI